MHPLTPISSLIPGQKAEVGQLTGRDTEIRRMQELGIHVGAKIEMISPGSPCVVCIDGKSYAFRATELIRVLTRPVDRT